MTTATESTQDPKKPRTAAELAKQLPKLMSTTELQLGLLPIMFSLVAKGDLKEKDPEIFYKIVSGSREILKQAKEFVEEMGKELNEIDEKKAVAS